MNPHSLLNFLATILILAMGLFAILRNRGPKINFSFFRLTLAASIWQLGTGLVIQAKDPLSALSYAKIGTVAICLIPVTSYHFTLYISGRNRDKILTFGYLAAILFFIPLSITTAFIVNGVNKYPWGFYFKAGPLHPLFLAFFVSYMLLVFFNLYSSYKKETSPLEKNRKKYFFTALFVAYIGSVDFLPNYGIGIYPFGYIAVICCFLIFIYAIQRYNLMDARVAITRAAVFVMTYIVVLTVPFISGFSLRAYLLKAVGMHWWLIPVCVMGVLALAGPFAYGYIQRRMEGEILKGQRKYQNALRQFSSEMTKMKNLPRFLDLTVKEIERVVKITHATIFLYNKDKDTYEIKASIGESKKKLDTEITAHNLLVKLLFVLRTPIIYEEIDRDVNNLSAKGMLVSASDISDLRALMKQLDAAVTIPAFIEDKLLAFIVLGEKQSAEIYTQEDLDAFTTLINQTALAIDDVLAYEELIHTRDQLIKVEKLTTMSEFAIEVAHEIKNPLQAIKAFAELINEKYNDKDFREKFSRLVTAEVDRIDNFVRQLIKVAHPLPPKLAPVDINELLNSVLELMENDLANNKISVKRQYDINPVRIEADKDQLKQVFLNVVINAIDAMKDSRKRLLTAYTFSVQSHAIIKIADTGCGIPPDSIPRLFNPLFTTKEKGSGLGLSIVDTIIKNHKGEIKVESKLGEGSVFSIRI